MVNYPLIFPESGDASKDGIESFVDRLCSVGHPWESVMGSFPKSQFEVGVHLNKKALRPGAQRFWGEL